jgi:tetratricopeptide (TPR) repeat protein
MSVKDWHRAVDYFQQALQEETARGNSKNKDYLYPYWSTGICYELLGRHDQAVKSLDLALMQVEEKDAQTREQLEEDLNRNKKALQNGWKAISD